MKRRNEGSKSVHLHVVLLCFVVQGNYVSLWEELFIGSPPERIRISVIQVVTKKANKGMLNCPILNFTHIAVFEL